MSYTSDHAAALQMVEEAGSAVTLTKTTTTYDAATDTHTPSTQTVAGKAVQVPGRPRRYEALGLVESKAPTLLFVPDTYGSEPELGATLPWAGEVHTVRDVEPTAPDGTLILARLIVER